MRVLCMCPYHGGSHEQFLADWSCRSQHHFEVLALPPRHFKWRWRQASVGLSRQAHTLSAAGKEFDVIWTTALWNVAEMRGLLPARYRRLPLCTYFHENQFAYPSRSATRDAANGWDINLPLDNWTSCLASDGIWFNSAYNRDSLLQGARALLSRMPDAPSLETLQEIRDRARVIAPGIDESMFACRDWSKRRGQPLTIAWASRFEHDKRPDLLLRALERLGAEGRDFVVLCLGQQFKSSAAYTRAFRASLGHRLLHLGFVDDKAGYVELLRRADVVVSTAEHEFFGLGVLEAVAAGCIPCVPERLVYPELYPPPCLYPARSDEEVVASVADRLARLSVEKTRLGSLEPLHAQLDLAALNQRYSWRQQAPVLDAALETLQRQG